MDNYNIITVPHPSLKQAAQPVNRVDDSVRLQMDRMMQTMYDAPGIGLAGNQVDMLNRVLVMDISGRTETARTPIYMANPEIIWESEEISVMEEGCLSIPQQFADVQRPAQVRVKYLNYHGAEAELLAEGLLSHCVQHEIDHLDGVLFIDHISSLKRNMLLKRLDKLRKLGEIL